MRLKAINIWYLSVFGLLVFTGCSTNEQKEKIANRPNILWITIEDTSPHFIGSYGNKNAGTPMIDQLAKEGVRFINAFSTGTVCSASRSTLITGVKTYQTGTGNHRSNYPLPDFIKGFPHYLQNEGYYTSNNSKTDYNVANMEAFTSEAWNESSNKAGWWGREQGQPFFSVFNFNDSHQSRTMTESYSWYQKNVLSQLNEIEQIDDNDFEMPPFYNDSPAMRKQFARVYNSIKLADNKIGDLLTQLNEDHLMDSTIIFFFADHGEGIPRGKTNGINLGYRVPFIIWFPEMYKHLSPWGTAGMVTEEQVDFSDLAPTLISLAGGQVPSHMEGRILMGKERSPAANHLILSSDRSDNGIDKVRSVTNGTYMYSKNFMPFMPEARYIRYMEISEMKQQMRNDLETDQLNALQKSLFEARPSEFLYNIEKDPWETKNLVNEAEHQELLEQMRAKLKTALLASRDILLLPEYEIAIISKNTTPYEYRLSDQDYPVAQIYEAAALAGFREEDIASQQIELLKNTNPIVRYWAIMGLYSQDISIKEKFSSSILEAMEDQYPPVAVTASAMAYDIMNSSVAKEKLINFVSNENMELALMAINYLLYFDNKAPFIETVKTVRAKASSTYKVKAACTDVLGSLGLVPNNTDNSR